MEIMSFVLQIILRILEKKNIISISWSDLSKNISIVVNGRYWIDLSIRFSVLMIEMAEVKWL